MMLRRRRNEVTIRMVVIPGSWYGRAAESAVVEVDITKELWKGKIRIIQG